MAYNTKLATYDTKPALEAAAHIIARSTVQTAVTAVVESVDSVDQVEVVVLVAATLLLTNLAMLLQSCPSRNNH